MTVGIIAAGAYVPRLRLQRAAMAEAVGWFNPALKSLASGERAMANWDEDPITMGVEAARDCLGERDRSAVGRVLLASTTLPFLDRQNAGVVKEALALDDDVGSADVTGSQRAGATALLMALEASADRRPTLCVASDRRLARPGSAAEFINGDASAAMLVGQGELIAEFVGSHTTTVDFVDRFRPADRRYDYEWEGRWVRDEGYLRLLPEAIRRALEKFGLDPGTVEHLIVPLPAARVDRTVAKAAGVAQPALCDDRAAAIGYSGTAHPLLMLTDTLATATPGALIVLAAFGQGVDVLVFRATGAGAAATPALGVQGWLSRRAAETNYLKHLAFAGSLELEGGMRAELDLKTPASQLYRDRRTVLALIGGRCRETGTVQYPKSDISVAPNARSVGTQEDYPLAHRRARVVTFTADHLGFSPDPPACYGAIDFDDGGRMIVDFADLEEPSLEVGSPVRMMFRRRRTDSRGFIQYFWKAVPDYRHDAES